MSAASVRSELRKISSTRLWWGLLIGVAVYTAISAAASAAFAGVELHELTAEASDLEKVFLRMTTEVPE